MATLSLVNLGEHVNMLNLPNGSVLFSYSTPVAAYVSGRGWMRTATQYSKTTTKHINKWLDGVNAEVVPQIMIDDLLEVRV
jgi:hypothetical protein